MAQKGKVVSVNRSTRKGVVKESIPCGELRVHVGLVGDAHAGEGKRQLSLLAAESIHKMEQLGVPNLRPGSFAENITTEGITLHTLPVGTRLLIGETLHVITQIGKECHKGCAIRQATGACIMPTEGVFTNVLRGGVVRPGDVIRVLPDDADFSHLDEKGNVRMVDVSAKAVTVRRATAAGRVTMRQETLDAICGGRLPKGDVLAAARVAGVMAAKKTSELIPMCHLLPLDSVTVHLEANAQAHAIDIRATTACTGKTGVEMEALTAVSVAALTLYDMCKSVDRAMCIGPIYLVEKEGGKSGHFVRSAQMDPLHAMDTGKTLA